MANHTATQTVPPALAVPATAPSVSLWTDALRRFRRHRLAVLGAAILTVMVIGVVAGPLVYRVPIDEIDFRAKLQGPSLFRVVGRPAASLTGFEYSDAMKAKAAAGLVWTADALDRYVADPEAFVPGTLMSVPPLRDERQRADLIAYLASRR